MYEERSRYSLFEHKHNFAVWAGARASQRAFLSTSFMVAAIEKTNIALYLQDPTFVNIDRTRFDDLHREWCHSICEYWTSNNFKNVTYGRAAKLVAIYLKTMVLVSGDAYTSLGRVIHPPVDRVLLKNLSDDERVADSATRKRWRGITWTTLDKDEYYELIEEIRRLVPSELPLWTIERYWSASEYAQEVQEDIR